MDTIDNRSLFPIRELSSENLTRALNNLDERLNAIAKGADFATVLSPTDRAVLDHSANFFGLHSVVAETLASKAAGVEDIDPTTGRARVIVERPIISRVELTQTGS